jgi:hypothetical protein
MPFQTIPGTKVQYALLNFDRAGKERLDDPEGIGGRFSARLEEWVKAEKPTHVFLFSHGWKGDVPAAIDQYDRWIKAMLDRGDDMKRFAASRPGFKPLWIGVHWPSLPWGDDEIRAGGNDFAADDQTPALLDAEELRKRYLERLGDSPEIRGALDVILEEARVNAAASELSDSAVEAYLQLNRALGLGEGGGDAAPGDDR